MWMRKKVVEKTKKRVTVQGPTSSPKNHASPDFRHHNVLHSRLTLMSRIELTSDSHTSTQKQIVWQASSNVCACVSLVGGFSIQCLERKTRDATPTL